MRPSFDPAHQVRVDERLESSNDAAPWVVLGQPSRTALGAVEGEIYQVRNQSNQDPLNFPIKLNNKLAALMGVVEGRRTGPPTSPMPCSTTSAVSFRLNWMKWTDCSQDLPALNRVLGDLDLDPIRGESGSVGR